MLLLLFQRVEDNISESGENRIQSSLFFYNTSKVVLDRSDQIAIITRKKKMNGRGVGGGGCWWATMTWQSRKDKSRTNFDLLD
jgi:hypothetical protein